MYQEHPQMQLPLDPHQQVWRYLNLAKFLHLIQTSKLYFARVDRLGDPFEGSISQLTKEHRIKIAEELKSKGVGSASEIPDKLSFILKTALKEIYVNCWHMNSTESAAMWNLYTTDSNSIAIQSIFHKLTESLEKAIFDVFAGVINYVDYDLVRIPEENLFFPFLHKRLSFRHEEELRAIIWLNETERKKNGLDRETLPEGLNIEVNLNKLIEKIYISPLAPNWFAEVVKNYILTSKIDKPIVHSRLNETPIF
ncbi:MAG: hypothetical protein L0Y80_11160 [Ignavibacteriae bacterium]|nr:hypothetical protein [Ignavibacteriota bacterium]